MNNATSHSENYHSALYFKAREIRRISRQITDYLLPDLTVLNNSGNEDRYIYFTGDIIRNSSFLIENIYKAENEYFQDRRMKYIASINRLTDKLYKSCERLENVNSNGKEFLRILRDELKKFRKLQRIWRLSL